MNKKKLEEQFIQQKLDEKWLSGKNYGVQEPIISEIDGQRQVTISAYMLASAIINTPASTIKNKGYVKLSLGKDKELAIDLTTREVLYFDDETGEETYLDDIILKDR